MNFAGKSTNKGAGGVQIFRYITGQTVKKQVRKHSNTGWEEKLSWKTAINLMVQTEISNVTEETRCETETKAARDQQGISALLLCYSWVPVVLPSG